MGGPFSYLSPSRADQWLGLGIGGNKFGTVIVELDDVDERLQGYFFAFEEEPDLPSIWGPLTVQKGIAKQKITARLFPFDPYVGAAVVPERLQDRWPGVELPETADLDLDFSDNLLRAKWTTSGASGSISTHSSYHPNVKKTGLPSKEISWSDFRDLSTQARYGKFAYRGQAKNWPLRTSFHRTRRASLFTYFEVTVPSLHKELAEQFPLGMSVATDMLYESILFTAQHHGFPTPTLDWTYSSLVAAYFAYVDAEPTEDVYVYQFDLEEWSADQAQTPGLVFHAPKLRFAQPFPSGNARQRPQHGLTMFSNIADIQTAIRYFESSKRKEYLRVYKLPATSRETALSELMMMNITPASLFPGLDGICKSARHRQFGFD